MTAYAESTATARPATAVAEAWLLDDGERLHLQHGPIDLVVSVSADPRSRQTCFDAAHTCFQPILTDLVAELERLRQPVCSVAVPLGHSPVARRMIAATTPFHREALTPMAAVAGAVADHILDSMLAVADVQRLMVNNGGDIALYLGQDADCSIGVCTCPVTGEYPHRIKLTARDGIGGIATSGWQGRSLSLGIADAVTVLARSAAHADAAATAIANQVDLPDNRKVQRVTAWSLDPDSDLQHRAVTVGVEALTTEEKHDALEHGLHYAQHLIDQEHIAAVFLSLQGETRALSPSRESCARHHPQSIVPNTVRGITGARPMMTTPEPFPCP